MEFSIIKSEPFPTNERCRIFHRWFKRFEITSSFSLGNSGKYSSTLRKLLLTSGFRQMWKSVSVKLSINFKKERTPWLMNVQLYRSEGYLYSSNHHEEISSILENICGGMDEFAVKVRLSAKRDEEQVEMSATLTGRELQEINRLVHWSYKKRVYNGGASFLETNGKTYDWIFSNSIQWMVSVDLVVSDKAVNAIHLRSQSHGLDDRIMMGPETLDAMIVADNGAIIKCNKYVLSAQCQYFANVFNSDMQEGITSTVKLSYVSEAGVQALLAYLYYREITELSRNCSIAVELLLAADMYCIQHLEECILELMLEKSYTWFTVSNAVHILRFYKLKSETNNNPVMQQIKEKVIKILKSKSDEELTGCEEYLQLFADPEDGRNMFTLLLRNEQ